MNFRQQRDYHQRSRQRQLNSQTDWYGNKKKEQTKGEIKGMTKLAVLIANRIPGSDLETVDKAVRECGVNNLVMAIQSINNELQGPPFASHAELNMMCAQLGVEVGSSLSSVMHLTVSDTGNDLVQHIADQTGGKRVSERVVAYALPVTHWIYSALEPVAEDAPAFDEIDTEVRTQFVQDLKAAGRNAIRKATQFGKDMDFDPDALIIDLVLELCGPTGPQVAEGKSSPAA